MIKEKLYIDRNIVILMAEDEKCDYDLAGHTLRDVGIENEIVWLRDGKETLDFFNGADSKYDENKKYILLLDIRMPKIDGITVLEEARKDNRLKQNVSIIMLTASDDPVEVTRCYDLGCNAHIIKPPDEALVMAIERVAKLL